MFTKENPMSSPKRLARIAGVLYLLNGVASGFAFAYVIGKVYVAGNAAATADKVLANAGLVRFGMVADLVQATEWIFLAIALYLLLRHVHEGAARTMVVLVSVGAAIVCLNDVFQFESVRIASDGSYAAALGAAGSSALVMLLMDMHHYGFLVAQIFFGLWLVPLGYLAYKSAMFPRLLGVALIVGGACYLVGMLAVFLLPDFGEKINVYVTIPSAIAEISMLLYLLVIGVKTINHKAERILAAA
jgi:uncharacterized protein DUF4386